MTKKNGGIQAKIALFIVCIIPALFCAALAIKIIQGGIGDGGISVEKDCDYQAQQVCKKLQEEGHNCTSKLVWAAHVIVECPTCGMKGQWFNYDGSEIQLIDFKTNYREMEACI